MHFAIVTVVIYLISSYLVFNTFQVWDIVKFNRLKVLYGHSGCVSSLQFNHDIL